MEKKLLPARAGWFPTRSGRPVPPSTTVEALVGGFIIDLQADAMETLALMTRTGSSRLMVTEGNRLAGIISLKDMMKFFGLKVELEP
jgi:CBS domain-containing protein